MVINVLKCIPHCSSRDVGLVIADLLLPRIAGDGGITLSFDGVDSVTPSFINAAFVSLLERYSIEEIKRKVRVINGNKQITHMIKDRLEFEAKRKAAAAH